TIDDIDFKTFEEALAYFSQAKLAPVIGTDQEKYRHVPILVKAFYTAGYHSRNHLAAILANLIYETSNLKAMQEAGSGDQYEGRKDLGNTEPGDGRRFKGRGYAEIGGRENYQSFGTAVGVDLVRQPERAAEAEVAAKIAVEFFKRHPQRNTEQKGPPTAIVNAPVDILALRKMLSGANRGVEEVGRIYGLLVRQRLALK